MDQSLFYSSLGLEGERQLIREELEDRGPHSLGQEVGHRSNQRLEKVHSASSRDLRWSEPPRAGWIKVTSCKVFSAPSSFTKQTNVLPGRTQHPVRRPGSAMEGKFVSPPTSKMRGPPLTDYATPKVQTVHRATVIHKEKLGISGNRRTPVAGSNPHGIPTAHVSPHLSMGMTNVRHSASGLNYTQQTNDESNLRRVASTDLMSHLQSDLSGKNHDNIMGITPTKRWSSMQNVSAKQHSFQQQQFDQDHRGMLVDTDPTLHQSHFLNSADDTHRESDYRYKQSVLSQSQHHQDPAFTGRVSPYSRSPSAVSPHGTATMMTSSGSYHGIPNAHLYKTPKVSSSHLYSNRHLQNHPEISQSGYTQSQSGYTQTSVSPRSVTSDAEPSHVTGSGYYSPANSDVYSDITSWQQRHRDQLKRQHHDVLQALGSGGNLASVNAFLDPHKIDPVREAADSIIKEKDAIIEKLRFQLIQIERKGQDTPDATDTNQGKAAMRRLNYDPDMLYRMQDLHIDSQTPTSRTGWSSGALNTDSEVIMLEKKLGKREYEMQEMKNNLETDKRMKQEEMKLLQEKLSSKETDIEDWKKRYSEIKTAHDTLQKRLDAFDRYVADLPTAEQSAERVSEMKDLTDERDKARARVSELEKRLSSAKKSVRSMEESLLMAKTSREELQQRLEDTQAENAKLKKKQSFLEGEDQKPDDDVEFLKSEVIRLKGQYEQARKLLESKHKKLGSAENKFRKHLQELQERLSQEEATIDGLREDMHSKDVNLKKLRSSVKELSAQNEQLMEQNLSLEDKLKESEQKHTGERAKVEHKLLKELMACYAELQGLVQICIQRAEGQDPNISVLLGGKACSPSPLADVGSADTLQSLKYKLSRVTDLRGEIDKLRGIISDKYAEDMGENLNCITQ